MPKRAAKLCLISLFGSSSILGCSSADYLSIEPPEDVTALAALSFSPAGEFLRASALTPAGAPIYLSRVSDNRLLIVGFTSSQLDPMLLDDPAVRETPVEPALTSVSLLLPEPSWAVGTTDDELQSVPSSAVPPLTSAWLSDLCPPDSSTPLLLDASCVPRTCNPTLDRDGCRVSVEARDCGVMDFTLAFQPFGENTIGGGDCEPRTAEPPAIASVACALAGEPEERCEIDLYEAPEAPLFDVERIPVVEEPIAIPRAPEGTSKLGYEYARSGYLKDVAIIGGHVLVSSYANGARQFTTCVETVPTVIHIFSLEDLAPIGTSTAPPCLWGLVGVDAQTGLAAFKDEEGPKLGRIDADGRLLESVLIESSLEEPFTPIEIALAPKLDSGAVLLRHLSTGQDHGWELWPFEIPSLSLGEVARPQILGGVVKGVTALSGSVYALTDASLDQVAYVDFARGSVEGRGVQVSGSIDFGAPYWVSEVEAVLFPIPTELSLMTAVDRSGLILATAVPFETGGSPLSITRLSDDPLELLVGLGFESSGSYRGLVAPFDPVEHRFLPGGLDVGEGPIAKLISDGQGRVYGLSSWTGELLRITPVSR